jgi:ubiquilin
VSPTALVSELKKKCEEPTSLSADQIRLIFKGRILKDADSLDKYKIENDSAVHLVKGSTAASQGN